MSRTTAALTNATVHTGTAVLTGHAVLLDDGGRIAGVVPLAELPAGLARTDLGGGVLAPGFIDVQVNGGGGVLFNDAPTPEAIARIGAAHRRFGTTGFLPTLISTDRETMARAASAVRAALAERTPGVLGLHFEGPHLNPARRGIHDARHIRPLAAGDLDLLTSLGDAGVTVVTLAPERVPPEAIRTLAARHVRVCAGHTDGTRAELGAAIREGVAGFTHLFNAMSQLGSREPGAVGTALADPDVFCNIIVDGHHVHDDSVRIAWRAKARGRLFLVTDAMPPVGAEGAAASGFRLGDRDIAVRAGRCVAGDGRLAGSALDMAGAVRRCVRRVGVPLDEALRMASTFPAEFLGRGGELGRIAPGWRADLVLLDGRDLRVRATWIGGRMAAA